MLYIQQYLYIKYSQTVIFTRVTMCGQHSNIALVVLVTVRVYDMQCMHVFCHVYIIHV